MTKDVLSGTYPVMMKDEISLKEAMEGASYIFSAIIPISNPLRKEHDETSYTYTAQTTEW